MIVVAGHVRVEPHSRDEFLVGCARVVGLARSAEGCLDFAITADLVDPGRVNIYERWADEVTLAAFRGTGPDADQTVAMIDVAVDEFQIVTAGAA